MKRLSLLKDEISSAVYRLLRPGLALVVLLVVGAVGYALSSHITFEAEAGTLTGQVTNVTDSAASNGAAIQFNGTSSSDPYADIVSNFNVNDWLVNGDVTESSASEPTGSFRFLCEFAKLGYVDPIVYPGQADKGHLHMFFGNTDVNENSTYQSLRTTGSSTCPGGPLNRTGYWMPAVFDANDGNKVVVPDMFNVYYKGEWCGSITQGGQDCIRSIQEFPNGLRMIAGYDMAKDDSQPKHHSWYCSVTQGTKPVTIPQNCPQGEDLLVAVYFPQCWDGVRLDSPNHRDHVAYISYNDNGIPACPNTHPVRLPVLTEFAIWTNPGNTSGWSLSSDHMEGMTHARGSTFHADWFGAWDDVIERTWVENCIRGMRNSNSGNLCNGKQLKPIQNYTGSMRISGYTDYYK